MITPAESPVVCPENAPLVDVLRGLRYDFTNLADRIGDLERAIRLHATRVEDGQTESIARIFDVGEQVARIGALRTRETKTQKE